MLNSKIINIIILENNYYVNNYIKNYTNFACTSCWSLSTLGRWDSECTPFYSATGGRGQG